MRWIENTRLARARRLLLGTGAIAALLLLAAPVEAQEPPPRWTVGWGGSLISYSPFLEADGELLTRDIGLENGIGGTVFVDRWLSRWVAIHLDGLYHRSELRLPEESPRVDTWAVNLGAMIRPFGDIMLPVAPYVFGTGGLISYGLGGASLRIADGVIFDADGTEQLLVQVGGGMDFLLLETWEQNTIGLRLEAARMIPWERPFQFEEEGPPGSHGFWRFTIGLSASILPY